MSILSSVALGLATGKALVGRLDTGHPLDSTLYTVLSVCLAFRNIGNLPLVVMPSCCRMRYFVSHFDSVDVCVARANSYVAINVSTTSLVQFSIVQRLFASADDKATSNGVVVEGVDGDWMGWLSWLRQRVVSIPPPAFTAIVGAMVSMSRPLKTLVESSFVSEAASLLAQASVGATVPLLGSTLYNTSASAIVNVDALANGGRVGRGPLAQHGDGREEDVECRHDHDRDRDHDHDRDHGAHQPSRLSVAFFAKLVPLQLVVMPWASSAVFLSLVWLVDRATGTTSDPLMLLTAVVAASTPPAVILLSLAVYHGVSPRLMSQLLLVLYCAAAFILPCNIVVATNIIAKVFV